MLVQVIVTRNGEEMVRFEMETGGTVTVDVKDLTEEEAETEKVEAPAEEAAEAPAEEAAEDK